MNLLSKETLMGAVALGAGAITAKVVQKKLLPLAKITNPNIQNLITLGVGIFTPTIIQGAIGKGLGAGMIAVSVAGLVDPFLSKAGLTGVDDDNVFMGDVLMGDDDSSGTLMGATDSFSSANDDYTSGGAGEMDY
jgi:hypothetical protein